MVNPTGKEGAWRGADWVEESNNLFAKVRALWSMKCKLLICSLQHDFGGRGSNYTKARVIEESPLVEIYRSCHHNIERNFNTTGLTQRHGPPNLSKTFEVLATYFKTHSPNEHCNGRKSAHTILDMIDRGLNNIEPAADLPDDVDREIDAEDLEVELL
jgi:hypothetical protein